MSRNLSHPARIGLLALALALTASATPPNRAEPTLSPAEEMRLGDAIASRIAAQAAVVEQAGAEEMLLAIARGAFSEPTPPPWPWRIHVLRGIGITSFDTVGGHVYVSRDLILACSNAAELRAALTHQLAHAIARDTLRRISAGYGSQRTLALARDELPSVLDGIAANLAASGTLVRHVDNVELRADADTARGGASPAALHALLTRLSARGERQRSARYFDVHPVTRPRLTALLAQPGVAQPGVAQVSRETTESFEQLRALLADP